MKARLIAALLVGAALVPGLAERSAADESDGGAIQEFGACLAGGGQGELLLLMDTSASLQDSDPGDQRVEAATYLVDQLSSFAEQSGASVDVAVAGFAESFDVSLDWTSLDGRSTSRVLDAIASYRDRTSGFETDYWVAVNGARAHLAKRADEGDCTALVWLSDGMYDLDAREGDDERDKYGVSKPYGPDVELTTTSAERALEKAGARDLCRTGGVADALRADGITTLAIGLQGDNDASSFDLMKGVATGGNVSGSACGGADASQLGQFVLAGQVGELFLAFDQFSDPDRAPIEQESPLCQAAVCPEGTHQFVLDPSISSVQVLGSGGIEDFYAVLTAPDGTRVRLDPGSDKQTRSEAFTARASWLSDTVFSLTINRQRDRGWTGAWRMTFVDPNSTGEGVARSNIRLYGDLRPAWLDEASTRLVVGEQHKLLLGLQRKDGSTVDPSTLAGTIAVSAQLAYADGDVVEIADGLEASDLAEAVELDLRSAPSGPAALRLTLTLTTADAGDAPGTTLEPQSVDYPLTVNAPPDYPSVGSEADFGTGDTDEPVRTKLTVEGDGCVWLSDAESRTLPDGVKAALVTSSAESKGDCATGPLTLTLDPDAVGSGLASGTLTVMTLPADQQGEAVPVTVSYRYEMQRPPNEGLRWALFAALLFVGFLVPLLLLFVLKWWTARIAGTGMSWLAETGQVDAHASFLAQWAPDRSRIQTSSLDGLDRRRVPLTSRTVLKVRARYLALSAPGDVVVDDRAFVSSAGASIPLAVQNHWIALLDPANPATGPVEVVFVLSPDLAKLDELVSDARARVPEAVTRLREQVGAAASPIRSTSDWDDADLQRGPATAAPADDDW